MDGYCPADLELPENLLEELEYLDNITRLGVIMKIHKIITFLQLRQG